MTTVTSHLNLYLKQIKICNCICTIIGTVSRKILFKEIISREIFLLNNLVNFLIGEKHEICFSKLHKGCMGVCKWDSECMCVIEYVFDCKTVCSVRVLEFWDKEREREQESVWKVLKLCYFATFKQINKPSSISSLECDMLCVILKNLFSLIDFWNTSQRRSIHIVFCIIMLSNYFRYTVICLGCLRLEMSCLSCYAKSYLFL